MKTMTPNEAVHEIMQKNKVTGASIYRAMATNEPGIVRQIAYDRIKSTNPKISTLNAVTTPMGYSVVLVPNDIAGKLNNECYKLATAKNNK